MVVRDALYYMPNPLACWAGVHLWLRGVVVLVPTNWCVGIHLWLRSVVAWVPTRGCVGTPTYAGVGWLRWYPNRIALGQPPKPTYE